MKKVLLFILCFCATITVSWAEDLPAFPGAEGFGRYVTGAAAVSYIMLPTSMIAARVRCVGRLVRKNPVPLFSMCRVPYF